MISSGKVGELSVSSHSFASPAALSKCLWGTKGKQQAGATLKVVGRSRTADFTLATLSLVFGSDKEKRPVACRPTLLFALIDTLLSLSEKR